MPRMENGQVEPSEQCWHSLQKVVRYSKLPLGSHCNGHHCNGLDSSPLSTFSFFLLIKVRPFHGKGGTALNLHHFFFPIQAWSRLLPTLHIQFQLFGFLHLKSLISQTSWPSPCNLAFIHMHGHTQARVYPALLLLLESHMRTTQVF